MLGDVWDLKLMVNTKIVQDVIAIAQGEVALESFLKQVKETWTYYTLELVNYQNTCRLIKNWDELFQKCGDHLSFLTAMHHSPYFKVFEEEARGWEDKLNRIHALFDCWIDVQRQWVYLEGVFNNNDEIKHVLPVESSRFQNINSDFFVILRKVYKSPLVLDILNIQGIQSSIERLLDLLTRVQKALGEYFEKERQKFGRLYFIGDEDLLEIIGNSKDVARIEKHLKKLFAGIAGLLYDSDNSMIIGVRSREGEELLLGSKISLAKFSKAVDLLVKLEEETKLSISANLKSSVVDLKKLMSGDITEESYLDWIQQYPAQVLVLSSQVDWTFTVNDALADVGSQLPGLRDKTASLLELLAGLVLKDISIVNRRKCEALVTELIHQRDIISQLLDERVKDADDFLWLSQLTYHFDPEKKPLERLVVKQSNATFTYGFEYLGVPDRIVYTPLIDRCFLTMTQALDQKLVGSPFGPAGTGMIICYFRKEIRR
jgi:dynein heavy chain 1